MEAKKEQMKPADVSSLYFQVAPGVWGTKDVFVNMYMVQDEHSGKWVLIDAGLKSSAARIKKMATELFGEGAKPEAIILTHGHFDHIGAIPRLQEEWHVSVYCHYLELPYLSGKSAYPPPDSTVDGGLMAKMSWLFPKKPVNLQGYLEILPPDGSVPFLEEWKYIYTPGHAPGHVSFFRPKDRVLIAGDAIVTTISESVLSVMTQRKRLSGPPKYFTYDWVAAKHSVMAIAALNPEVVVTGHGKPMTGDEMKDALVYLRRNFDQVAVPKRGRYKNEPAVTDASGVMYVPPKEKTFPWLLLGIGLGAAAAITAIILIRQQRKNKLERLPGLSVSLKS